ncbi:hypothetical protein GH714_017698 [Hevea brasiliensis]|uniref:Uncharacterized protein n=1 Tax=Hevea brasiliensis TaxID=3981 RepID=A0A6A6LPN2_HEVBR|nr:hypothetical protein GH714_017698 [Hevea brasiliensis]
MASSSNLLDYALFQLTLLEPEKLASGLFEPFTSDLKFAKDQISRGGYSIKLCPPTGSPLWLNKTTFERFVRFVNTPVVLKRFVSLEKEILQIESAAQANDLSNTGVAGILEEGSELAANSNTRKSSDSSKLKGELGRHYDTAAEENSKIQLQWLLETRKTLLRKEQAMAYARGLVAGFEVHNIDDLIFFAEAFGASRLSAMCIKIFIDISFLINNRPFPDVNVLCSADDNLSTSDQMSSTTTKVQVPVPWSNQIPQYMYNFQNPQQLPPDQGYPFPMQPILPHYVMMSMQRLPV